MHAAKRALLRAQRIIDLTEMTNKIMLAELVRTKRASEEAAFIASFLEVDQARSRQGCWGEDHGWNTVDLGPELSHALKPVEASLQSTQSDELVSNPILFAKAMIDQLTIQFLHAAREIILKLKIREQFVQQIEFDAVIPRIDADLARIGNFRARDKAFHPISNIAHLIILTIAADVHGFVVNYFLWCIHESNEGSGDVAAVDERAPGRTVRHDAYFASGDCACEEIVDDEVDA